MKTVPPPCPEPESGVRYWRGLDDLAGTPEFRNYLEREFPDGASELNDPATRRSFMKVMGASIALAGVGLTGCRRPEEKILPFGRQPEGYTHGVPQYFATAMPTRTGAVPLVVKQHDGRPVKVEGNDRHPDSNGGTDAYTQASILDLYDPDRSRRFLHSGNDVSRVAAIDALSQLAQQAAANKGAGLAVLTSRLRSPSFDRVAASFRTKLPQARWYTYESVDFDIHRQGAALATGKVVEPYFRVENAQVILSLDCDLLGREEENARYNRGFAKGRKAQSEHDSMNRLYVAEPVLSVTGSNADHRLRIASGQVFALAAAIAAEILPSGPAKDACAAVAKPAGVDPKWITECAADLVAHKGKALVMAGYGQPLAVHVLSHAINAALEGAGHTVEYRELAAAPAGGSISELATALNAGQVETLVVLHGNPAYDAPVDLKWSETQRKAKNVVRLGYYEDETTEKSDWHFPAAHYLESWGDARTSDGTLVPIQPLIEPLFGGITALEILARLAGETVTKPYDIVRATFFAGAKAISEDAWERFLHDGFLAKSAGAAVSAAVDARAVAQAVGSAPKLPAASKDSLEVVFLRDSKTDDGRYSNNAWLQEFPDPITKMVWDNAALISRKTASDLGLVNTEIVTLEVGGRQVKAPVWITPGMADHTIGVALGYGRRKPGRVACYEDKPVGFNGGELRTSQAAWIASGARASGTKAVWTFATTQSHWAMSGRPIVREANLPQYKENPKFASNFDLESHSEHIAKGPDGNPLPLYKTAYEERPATQASAINQWGMAIDLSACTGCGACVIACQSENNIPVVGKDQVIRGREMQWLRIDRYFTGYREGQRNKLIADEDQWKETWIDDPQVVNQPMMCQHCEKAPCESVCPVNATVHDEEGLNIMAYNRCVGTRYCSNNCAWKVRRFNFFDYNKRPNNYGDISEGNAGKLYAGPFAKRSAAELELVKMAKNPEVTVRMRGVMEKCTFCTQRIEATKIARKVKAGASGDVQVTDADGLKTACQQVCPAEAIVFGNQLETGSRVNQWKKNPRNYAVLGFLDTRPRLTYLAKLRNPNPKMPDFHEVPLSIEEYKQMYHGDPFAAHGAGHGDSHGAGADAGHAKTAKEGAH